jgi:hypothetical protein
MNPGLHDIPSPPGDPVCPRALVIIGLVGSTRKSILFVQALPNVSAPPGYGVVGPHTRFPPPARPPSESTINTDIQTKLPSVLSVRKLIDLPNLFLKLPSVLRDILFQRLSLTPGKSRITFQRAKGGPTDPGNRIAGRNLHMDVWRGMVIAVYHNPYACILRERLQNTNTGYIQ